MSICVLLLVLLISTSALAQLNRPTGMPDNSKAFGKTYGEWSAAWWKWALEIPATDHPLFDSADCSTGQTGHVWFLGGAFCASGDQVGCADPMHPVIDRSCAVPTGTALFFPVLNGEDAIVEEANWVENPTEMLLRTNVKSWNEPGDNFMVVAKVDGWDMHVVRICSKGDYCLPQQSPLFDFTLPNHDNILKAIGEFWVDDGVSSSAVSDGYYVLIPPLPAGKHTITFYGINGVFSLDVTYHLTVK